MVEPELLTQLKLLGNDVITVQVGGLQIIEQTPALAHHHEQATTGTVIFFVLLQVLIQMVNALG